jgi:hypothetical protein
VEQRYQGEISPAARENVFVSMSDPSSFFVEDSTQTSLGTRSEQMVTKMVANAGPQTGFQRDDPVRAVRFPNTNQYLSAQNETGRNDRNQISSAVPARLIASILTTGLFEFAAAANDSAGINSVDAGINGAIHLGEQRLGGHDDRSHSTDHRKLVEHYLSLPLGLRQCLPLPLPV